MLKKRKNYKRLIYSPIFLLFLFLFALVLVKALWGVNQKQILSAEYLDREQGELDRLLERQKQLAQSVEYLKTDKGVEAEIRSKFRMVKDGESIAVIVDNEKAEVVVATTTPQSKGFFDSFLNWFR